MLNTYSIFLHKGNLISILEFCNGVKGMVFIFSYYFKVFLTVLLMGTVNENAQ